MKIERFTLVYIFLTILPALAAMLVYGQVPESVEVIERITVSTGRIRIFILPVTNLVIGGLFFVLLTNIERAQIAKARQTGNFRDMSRDFMGMKLYLIVLFDVICFCSIYGFYALDWGGNATTALMYRGGAAMLGIGGILAGFQFRTSTMQSVIALRWKYTCRSENVWFHTHKLAARLFYFAGIFSIACAFFYNSYQALIICLLSYVLVMSVLYYYCRRLYFDEFR